MSFHLPQITVIADMISDAIRLDISPHLLLSGRQFSHGERLKDRARIVSSAAQIVDLTRTRIPGKGQHEPGDIFRVNVIADLFTLVAENLVFLVGEIAADQVTQESMQFDSGVIGAS